MTVDEILATERYTDRRGRAWNRRWSGLWAHAEQIVPVLGVLYSTRLPDQMRLLIERDMHRDECPGLHQCQDHPVPYVWIGHSGSPHHDPARGFNDGQAHTTLPEAVSAAYRLAVGS